jgi:hypothetical protein
MKGMRITFTLVVSLVLVGLAGAYPPGWKGPKTITKYGQSETWYAAEFASIAVNGDAIYMVYYTSYSGSGAYNWWFKKSTNQGLTWSDSILIWGNHQTPSIIPYSRNDAIVVDNRGIHVLLHAFGQPGQHGIFYTCSTDGGQTWGGSGPGTPPVDIASGLQYDWDFESSPALVSTPTGLVAAWRASSPTPYVGPSVWTSQWNGVQWSEPYCGLPTGNYDWYDRPCLVLKPGISPITYLIYERHHSFPLPAYHGIAYLASDNDGATWPRSGGIFGQESEYYANYSPSAAYRPTDGRVWVFWSGNSGDTKDPYNPNPAGWFRARYSWINEQNPPPNDFNVLTSLNQNFNQQVPRVAIGPLDSMNVVWEDNRMRGGSDGRYQIYYRCGGGDPIAWGDDPKRISEDANQDPINGLPVYPDLNPDIAFLSCSNSRVAVWDGVYNYPTDQSGQIWYHKKSTDNTPPLPPENLQVWQWMGPGLLLTWSPPDQDPLPSGYNIWRGDNLQPCRKITPQPVTESYYIDNDVNFSYCYDYYVTSLDCAENESVPSNHAYYWGCFGDGFQMAYVDAGTSTPSPYTRRRAGYLDWGGVPEKTVDYDPEKLTYRFEGLNPDSTYILKLGGFEEARSRGRNYSVEFDEVRVLSKGRLPWVPARTVFLVPKTAYRDGAVDVTFIRERGPNVVVAELWLLRIPTRKGGPQSTEVVDLQGAEAKLYLAYPNPTTGSVRFEYALARANRMLFAVYDVSGRLVRKLVDSEQAVGRYQLTWDGKDETGKQVSTGTYFYQLQVGSAFQTRKVLVVR